MIGIYKITNPNGRVYIGQSIDIDRRFRQYRRLDAKFCPKLYRSLKKYGYKLHKFEIIELCEVSMLNELERKYQELFNATSNENLNCILTKTNSKSGVGKPISDKLKKQISLVHKGKKYSEETKQKIRLARSKQIITQEHRQKMSDNSGSARLILNVETGIFYRTIKDAAMSINVKSNTLNCSLLGRNQKKTKFIYA